MADKILIKVMGEFSGEHKTEVIKPDGEKIEFLSEGYGIGTPHQKIEELFRFLGIEYDTDFIDAV